MHLKYQLTHSQTSHPTQQIAQPLTPNPQPLAPAFPGGRAYSALPCAGAPPPQRPLSYNTRRSKFECNMTLSTRCNRASPHPPTRSGMANPRTCPHTPVSGASSVPTQNSGRGRPCACPRTPSHAAFTSPLTPPVGPGLAPALTLPYAAPPPSLPRSPVGAGLVPALPPPNTSPSPSPNAPPEPHHQNPPFPLT